MDPQPQQSFLSSWFKSKKSAGYKPDQVCDVLTSELVHEEHGCLVTIIQLKPMPINAHLEPGVVMHVHAEVYHGWID